MGPNVLFADPRLVGVHRLRSIGGRPLRSMEDGSVIPFLGWLWLKDTEAVFLLPLRTWQIHI